MGILGALAGIAVAARINRTPKPALPERPAAGRIPLQMVQEPAPVGPPEVAPAAPRPVPQTLKEVDLPGRIRDAGHTDLKLVGEFFGWKPRQVTKTAADFTKDQLLANGWTKERLLNVAEGYEHIARITPANPSAAGRATQLQELAKLFD